MRLTTAILAISAIAISGSTSTTRAQITEDAKLTASDGASLDRFGKGISASEDTVVVGARFDACSAGSQCGAAYVFVKPAGGWSGNVTETAKLIASDRAPQDLFGVSVSVSGDTVVVGARNDVCAAGIRCGAVYVFVKPTGGWSGTLTETAKLTASDRAAFDNFGNTVALSESQNTIAVGADGNDCMTGSGCGPAYVFVSPTGGWSGTLTETAKIVGSDLAPGDTFGLELFMSGDTVVVGAQSHDCPTLADCGSAYVFEKPAGGWLGTLTESSKLIASDPADNHRFGLGVAIFEETVVIGARGEACALGIICGAAYVFEKPAGGWSGTLTENAKLIPSDRDDGDDFGENVAIAGDTIVASSAGDVCSTGALCGAVYVFEKPAGGWLGTINENLKLTASDAITDDRLGKHLSISGGTVVAGALHDDCADGSQNCGSAYVFELENEVSDSVVLSSNSVWLRQNSTVLSGNVIVTDESPGPTLASGVELTVGVSADVAAGTELKADSIKVKQNAVVDGDVFYNDLDNGGTINGSLNTPLDLPVTDLPPFESAPAGALDVLVPQNGFTTLVPGDYGDIQVKKKGKLVFLGGEYNVRSIDAGQACELLFSDAATVRVEERFDTDKNTVIGPDVAATIDASDIVFYVAGINGNNGNLGATPKAAQIGLNNTANANFYVPNGTLWIRQNTEATGAFVGKDVIVGIGATVSHDSAF